MALAALGLASCDTRPVLNILNWGEYINDEVVANFEEEYGINVKISVADSNELFYSKIKSGTTPFDLVIPSDYMIEKMAEEDMLIELDYAQLPNFNEDTNMDGQHILMLLRIFQMQDVVCMTLHKWFTQLHCYTVMKIQTTSQVLY